MGPPLHFQLLIGLQADLDIYRDPEGDFELVAVNEDVLHEGVDDRRVLVKGTLLQAGPELPCGTSDKVRCDPALDLSLSKMMR